MVKFVVIIRIVIGNVVSKGKCVFQGLVVDVIQLNVFY